MTKRKSQKQVTFEKQVDDDIISDESESEDEVEEESEEEEKEKEKVYQYEFEPLTEEDAEEILLSLSKLKPTIKTKGKKIKHDDVIYVNKEPFMIKQIDLKKKVKEALIVLQDFVTYVYG